MHARGGEMLVVALSQHTCQRRDRTGARLLEIAFMTSNGTICHSVLFSKIHVVVFSFKGSCCVSLCRNDIGGGGGGGVGLGKKKEKKRYVRIVFSLFFPDPLSNPVASLAFGTVLRQSDWML